ncbi:MAG TPA: DHH family phosphoesterase [Deltaproteobacteria bacterium]|nr:DHH family phosphoesterase [Deltaproteobacteria bacterium]HPR53957.1 DHH family phosphoesterase [Deltaproteobacteria bacterium]HXK46420.1 DHH family phosphoesterase [Deltaproteobacteria bacterium]
MKTRNDTHDMKIRIAEIIRDHLAFEIITHEGPDEDAVGSSKALGLALVSLGKTVNLVYPTPIPESLSFTETPDVQEKGDPEISILVDLSDEIMLRGVRPRGDVVVIDHHRTDGSLGIASWIDPAKSSSSEMVYDLLQELGAAITPAIASNLYMGLFGDTGGFMHANTNARVFHIAHELVQRGADPHSIAYRIKKTKALAFYRILCAAMNRMVMREGVFASYITHEEIQAFHARPEDASGIVEEMASLAGADLIIFLKEVEQGTVKASIRSKVADAALRTASAFGGGGHGLAAGCTMKGNPEVIILAMVEEGIKWACRA